MWFRVNGPKAEVDMIHSHLSLAMLCQQAYAPYGIPGALDVGGVGPRCFVIEGPPVVVAFCGTNDYIDVIDDLEADFKPQVSGHGLVHHGMQKSWRELKGRVAEAVDGRPVILTGHSLGGAQATLAALDLPSIIEVVTFGSPRVGDPDFVAYYQSLGLSTTRYVNMSDPVPWLPGYMAGYRHCSPCLWWNGKAWSGWRAWAWFEIMPRRLWTNKLKIWADHHIAKYVDALRVVG